jgi:hypothetical protein
MLTTIAVAFTVNNNIKLAVLAVLYLQDIHSTSASYATSSEAEPVTPPSQRWSFRSRPSTKPSMPWPGLRGAVLGLLLPGYTSNACFTATAATCPGSLLEDLHPAVVFLLPEGNLPSTR